MITPADAAAWQASSPVALDPAQQHAVSMSTGWFTGAAGVDLGDAMSPQLRPAPPG